MNRFHVLAAGLALVLFAAGSIPAEARVKTCLIDKLQYKNVGMYVAEGLTVATEKNSDNRGGPPTNGQSKTLPPAQPKNP